MNKPPVTIMFGLCLGRICCPLACRSVSGMLQVKGEITSATTSLLRRLKLQDKGRSSVAFGVARKLLCVSTCHLTPTSDVLVPDQESTSLKYTQLNSLHQSPRKYKTRRSCYMTQGRLNFVCLLACSFSRLQPHFF
jgi:hypothetical protein